MRDTAEMPRRHLLKRSGLLCWLMLSGEQSAEARQTALSALLAENRYQLTVENGTMAGPGAVFLEHEISEAQFVAVGEEHGTREVPEFVWAACRAMAQHGGLDAMAIEAGPLVTAQLQLWTAKSEGVASLSAFEKQYPDSIAFFNWRSEFDLLTHCRQATAPHPLQLWGLDQEFLGSPEFILQQIVEARPGQPAESIARKLQTQCALDTRRSIASESWRDACIFHLSQPELAKLQSAVEPEGNLRALELTAALIKTQRIYSAHENGHRYEANRERSLLMKHNFLTDYQRLSARIGNPPRVLLKFGDNHLFKGFNETDLNDLGNFVTEFADGLGTSSLHVAILGMSGEEEANFGPGQTDRAVTKDATPGVLAPLYAEAYQSQWTVFDCRALRSHSARIGHLDRALQRLLFGYDTLVLIPRVTAQATIK